MIELRYNFLEWFKRHHFLYVCGFLIFFRPINPFFYELLTSEKNVTDEKYLYDIQPISAYSCLVTSVIIFLFICFSFYNFVIWLTCFGGLVLSILLWKFDSFVELQIAEGIFGIVNATEIIYYASIYVCSGIGTDFSAITSHVRSIPLLSTVFAGVFSQSLISKGLLSYDQLAFLGLPACVHGFIIAVQHLPALSEPEQPPDTFIQKLTWFKTKLKKTLLSPHILKWCLWSAVTLCGYTRFTNLKQPFWRAALKDQDAVPNNGALEGISAFISMLSVLLCGLFTANMKQDNVFFFVISTLQGCLFIGLAHIEHVWDSTIVYLVLDILFNFAMVRVSAMIAENVYHRKGCFGIAFGFINVISALLNLAFVHAFNNISNHLTFQDQFMVYGLYYLITALIMKLCFIFKV